MNIFEAMERNGRAVLPDKLKFAYRDKDNEFCWYLYIDNGMKVSNEDLKRNDWMPDIPTEIKNEHGTSPEQLKYDHIKGLLEDKIENAVNKLEFTNAQNAMQALSTFLKLGLEWKI